VSVVNDNPILKAISALRCVDQIMRWEDRRYIRLRSVRNTKANADLRAKIYVIRTVLHIDNGAPDIHHSRQFLAEKEQVMDAALKAGGTVEHN
jgi:hypothetical protein